MCRCLRVIFVLFVCFIVTQNAESQVTTATFSGIVKDPTGGVIPGAEVTLTNEGTNATRTQVTNDVGEFVFNFVPVGSFTLTIGMPGFKTLETTNLRLSAGQNVRRTFELQVGAVAESVTVSSDAVLVNAGSTEQLQTFSETEVAELPLARRNFSQILEIGTGLTTDQSRGRIRLNGLGGSATKVTVDGTSASANPRSEGFGSYQGFAKVDLISLDSIAEVQTVKGVVPAEYGQALAGNLNVITKSGANDWHGSLFYNYQGAALAAKHPFAGSKPNFVWNQFGGSLGGPIIRDRAFFFFTYEGYQESNFSILNGSVPTPNFRSQMLEALPFDETQIFLDALPLPNQPHDPDAVSGIYAGTDSLTAEDNRFDVKGDLRVGAGNVSVSWTRAAPEQVLPRLSPINRRTWSAVQNRLAVSYVLAGANWTSETRFGRNHNPMTRLDGFFEVMDPNNEEVIPLQRRAPSLRCCGLTNLGSEKFIFDQTPTYTLEEKYAIIIGQHSLKFGGIYTGRAGDTLNTENADVRFESAEDLLANSPSLIQVTFGQNPYSARSYEFGFFVQDDWRIHPRLTLNLGLRYDYFSNYVATPDDPANPAFILNLDGLQDRDFNFGPVRDPNNPMEADPFNLGPRIGFAYNPDGEAKTIIRGGYSVMFAPIPYASFARAVARSEVVPFRVRFSRQEAAELGLGWPVYNEDVLPILEAQEGLFVDTVFNPKMEAPYAQNLYLGVQRTLTSTMMFETAFIGTRGVKFTMERRGNFADRDTGIRPNPNLGEILYVDNSEQTFYASWQSSLRKRFSQNFLFDVHYTWAKGLAYTGGDIASGPQGDSALTVQDFWCIECARGPVTGDLTHVFSGNWLYEVSPTLFEQAVLKHVLGGWRISGIFKATTGAPLNVEQPNSLSNQRPDVLDLEGAVNSACCGYGQLQYLTPAAFQLVPVDPDSGATIRPGSLGNNALRRPGFSRVDLSLGKNFGIPWFTSEGARLQIRTDFLNAFNKVNYSSIVTNPERSNFGRATDAAQARVIQLTGRITF